MKICRSILSESPAKTIKQKIISIIHNSKQANQLHEIPQIHAFLIKTSLQSNNLIIANLLCKFPLNIPGNLLYARNLFDEMPSPDTFLWNTMIRAYLNSQNHFECLSLFIKLRSQERLELDSFSLSLVVQACGRAGFVKNGETIHTQVVKLGFGCDLFVQTGLVKMYAKFGCVDFARKMFSEMKDPDLVLYNVLLAEYVRIGELGLAREVFDSMSIRDHVSWNTMIHGYASFVCDNEVGLYDRNMSHEALSLFNEMQLAKFLPDKITVVSVLSACRDLGALDMGKTVHKYIERNQIEVDMQLGTSLVNMYAKCGDVDNASKVFNGMKRRDLYLWSAMIMGLANHGYGDAALDHFDTMISKGVKPNGVTFLGVLSACSHIGLVDEGWKYFNSMHDVYGVTREIEHYGCMVDILSRAGELDAARDVIRNMPFEPDAIIWRTLLGACKIFKNVELAEEATNEILTIEAHTDGNYVLLSNIYSQAKRWDEAITFRSKMKDSRIHKIRGSNSTEVGAVHDLVSSDWSHLRC